MAEQESYVTKQNPTTEDWLEYNRVFFARLKGEGEAPTGRAKYSPLTDADVYAARENLSVEEYFERMQEQVGPLGNAALKLVHSDMDDAWHITVGLPDQPET